MKYKSNEKNKKIENNTKQWIKSIGMAIIIAIFIKTFIFNVTYVKGDSMNPTLKESDRLILKKYGTVLKTEEYKRGDIVVFESPLENDNRSFIKRVIGVPGDKINISNGELYINDEYIKEPYIANNSFTESLSYGDRYIVLENELFVIGDNRFPGESNDSRSFGSVSLENIEGKVVLRIFPLNKIGKDF